MKINWWKVLVLLCFVFLLLVYFGYYQEVREKVQYIENKGWEQFNTEYGSFIDYLQNELKKNEELLNRGK